MHAPQPHTVEHLEDRVSHRIGRFLRYLNTPPNRFRVLTIIRGIIVGSNDDRIRRRIELLSVVCHATRKDPVTKPREKELAQGHHRALGITVVWASHINQLGSPGDAFADHLRQSVRNEIRGLDASAGMRHLAWEELNGRKKLKHAVNGLRLLAGGEDLFVHVNAKTLRGDTVTDKD
jgi:hypothetical protein